MSNDPEFFEKLESCRRERDGCYEYAKAQLDSCNFSEVSSCSSSIGRNSDASGRLSNDEDGGENEVQSQSLREEPLDMMQSLEEALPLRRGISKFYNGKAKSFTTLADASSSTSSIKDIAKSENADTRKRRNLLAFSYIWDKNRITSRRSNGVGISKRAISSSPSTLALAASMSSCESHSSEYSNSRSPPLYPQLRSSGNNLTSH